MGEFIIVYEKKYYVGFSEFPIYSDDEESALVMTEAQAEIQIRLIREAGSNGLIVSRRDIEMAKKFGTFPF